MWFSVKLYCLIVEGLVQKATSKIAIHFNFIKFLQKSNLKLFKRMLFKRINGVLLLLLLLFVCTCYICWSAIPFDPGGRQVTARQVAALETVADQAAPVLVLPALLLVLTAGPLHRLGWPTQQGRSLIFWQDCRTSYATRWCLWWPEWKLLVLPLSSSELYMDHGAQNHYFGLL